MRLRDVRQSRKLSISFLAGNARVSPNLVWAAEVGRATLSTQQARKIADVLSVDVKDVDELRDAVPTRRSRPAEA